MPPDTPSDQDTLHEARLWRDQGWTARVVKNNDDEGWAVEMIKQGEPEPALVGPWTMGRDKKNPKPLDSAAFNTLVKTASEVLRRHEQQRHALLHRQVTVASTQGRVEVMLDIVPDDDDPHALLAAQDAAGDAAGPGARGGRLQARPGQRHGLGRRRIRSAGLSRAGPGRRPAPWRSSLAQPSVSNSATNSCVTLCRGSRWIIGRACSCDSLIFTLALR